MLDNTNVKHIRAPLLSMTHNAERPTRRQTGEAFFIVWRGDRLAVRTRGVHPRNVSCVRPTRLARRHQQNL